MQFTVPQFIDVEDKIIGPITIRQFIISLAGFILMAIGYKLLDFTAFVAFCVFIFGVFGTFAFARINGRPFHYFVLNLIQTFKKPQLRVWNQILSKTGEEEMEEIIITKQATLMPTKQFSGSRLAELSLVVDTKGSYQGETKWRSDIQVEERRGVE